jgi:hypothetical protein
LFLNSSFVGFGDSVFLGICQHDIHVFIEGKEGAYHHSAILDGDPDSEVYPLEEFTSLCGHVNYNRK